MQLTYSFVSFVCCLTLIAASLPKHSMFTRCPKSPQPLDLRVKGCTRTPCKLKRGTSVAAEMDFIVDHDVQKLVPKARGWSGFFEMDYPLDEKDACASITGAKCPLKKNDKVTYAMTLPVRKDYIPLSMEIEFLVEDENKKKLVCFRTRARLI